MQDVPIEVRRGALRLSTDRQHLDHAAVLALLRTTYWGGSLSPEALARALQNSICFAVFVRPIGVGREVGDGPPESDQRWPVENGEADGILKCPGECLG